MENLVGRVKLYKDEYNVGLLEAMCAVKKEMMKEKLDLITDENSKEAIKFLFENLRHLV